MIEINWKCVELPCDLKAWRKKDYEVDFPEFGYVYVIDVPDNYAIQYPNGVSTVCYIGRQGPRKNGSRIHAHANGWISRFQILTREKKPFLVHFADPIDDQNEDYRSLEAQLISAFESKFEAPPLFNRSRGGYFDETILQHSYDLFRRRRLAGRVEYTSVAQNTFEG